MALITQSDVEAHLGLAAGSLDGTEIDLWILQAQSIAEQYCHQPLEESQGIVETFEVDQWEPWHRLARFPVTAVDSVVEDTVTLTETTDYLWYDDGRIRRVRNSDDASWSRYVAGVVVTYDAGYTSGTVPEGLKLALESIAADLYRAALQHAAVGESGPVKQVSLDGSDSITWQDSTDWAVTAVKLTDGQKQLLSPYRRRPM